jgi:predicted enzyme related to lactoylglutathione lyase
MNREHHGIDYVEIYVADMDATLAFYGAAFGWSFTRYAPGYVGIQKPGGGEWGGFSLEEKIVRGGPLVVLFSESLEKTRDAVVSAGGQLAKDIFEFPGGRRFHFLDPSGNELAVWGS